MVGEYDEGGGAGLEDSVPMSNGLDDSEKFAVVRAITALNIGHLARPVSDWTKTVGVALRENGSDGEPRGVCFQLGGEGRVKVAEKDRRTERKAKLVEGGESGGVEERSQMNCRLPE